MKKIKAQIDENGYIVGYAEIGDISDSIDVYIPHQEFDSFVKEPFVALAYNINNSRLLKNNNSDTYNVATFDEIKFKYIKEFYDLRDELREIDKISDNIATRFLTEDNVEIFNNTKKDMRTCLMDMYERKENRAPNDATLLQADIIAPKMPDWIEKLKKINKTIN